MNREVNSSRGEEMDAHALRVLDFYAIVEMLVNQTQTVYGGEIAEKIKPLLDLDEIRKAQEETSEAVEWLGRYGEIPWGSGGDIRPILNRAKIGGVLSPEELFQVKEFLGTLRQIRSKVLESRSFPLITSIVKEFHLLPALEKEIEKSVSPAGEILDSASFELLRLRKQARLIEGRLREKLQSLIDSPTVKKFLQEPIITIRDDRFVVPVKAEFKSQFPGVVHDRSSSGQTVFLEPIDTVNINNELREAQMKIRDEEDRILTDLSRKVGEQAGELQRSLQALARLDFIFAKARLSDLMKGNMPRVEEGAYLDLVGARHPLLKGEVVPIDIQIGKGFHTLVITGPNTGGKTVSLKTAGLLVLMAQAGLHLPASSNSSIGIFKNVFADIGDEQSIQQSLSTFSAHMAQIVRILREADPQSLVLLDELGSGTDPREGAALGASILEFLHEKRIPTIASTHHTELVAFAYLHRDARNASMEFDQKTLAPTYRMRLGIPGASHAFQIAKKLGLLPEVLADAQKHLTLEREKLDLLISKLEEERQKVESDKAEAEKLKEEALKFREEFQKQTEEIKKKKKQILRSAYEEAQKVVNETKSQMEELLEKLRQEPKVSARTEAIRKEVEEAKTQVDERMLITERRGLPVSLRDLHAGDLVWIPRFKAQGLIVEIDEEKGKARVQVGSMRATVEQKEIERMDTAELKDALREKEIPERPSINFKKDVSWKIDLHGARVDDALQALDKYIDDAVMANFPFVYILHGRGTGALRTAIHNFLRNHPSVLRFRMGEATEGGPGVTIVYLK
ncbi:MAG: endonuclease MutS2 [Caldiserica bacterium]|nr:endonuclease MutS2 [Caldisericota bacterium]MDH7562634.1 endonuclease MutS2 [Caldisericota bacterium]